MEKIVSGGQTGADRAGLDAALELGISLGGWCPRGRRAEDGPIDSKYPLRETGADDCRVRTELNVRDSDGTLIFTVGEPTGGTALTMAQAVTWGKPYLVIDLGGKSPDYSTVRAWLVNDAIRVLNIAGPRESEAPGIYDLVKNFLNRLLPPLLPGASPI